MFVTNGEHKKTPDESTGDQPKGFEIIGGSES